MARCAGGGRKEGGRTAGKQEADRHGCRRKLGGDEENSAERDEEEEEEEEIGTTTEDTHKRALKEPIPSLRPLVLGG